MKDRFGQLSFYLTALGRALRSPTPKQKEAYARYTHTISAAVLIAAGAMPFTSDQITVSVILKVTGACMLALALLCAGALLLEES